MTQDDAPRQRGKTVTVQVFESEPLARLAAMKLEGEGIPCMVRSIGVGPGGWGLAANVPHALDTWEDDADRAREALALLPAEVEESLQAPIGGGRGTPRLLLLGVAVIVAVALVVQAADALFSRLLG